MDDAWNEVVAGRLVAVDFLTFVERFSAERELAVWQAISIGLRGIGRLLQGDAYVAFQRRVAALVQPVLVDVGWAPVEGETELRAKLRGTLVGVLAVLGNDADAQQRCRRIVQHETDPELVVAAVNAIAAVGTDEEYDQYLARFRVATTPQEMQRYMFALAAFPTREQMERTIALTLSGEVRTQNAPYPLNVCIANRWNGEFAWQQVRRHWTEINDKFPDNTIVRMVDSVKLLNAPAVVADVQSFFAEHPIPQGLKMLDQVLERQRTNAALFARENERLTRALVAQG